MGRKQNYVFHSKPAIGSGWAWPWLLCLVGDRSVGCCCFSFGSISGIWWASPQPLHSSHLGRKGGCPVHALPVLPLGVEAILIRNKAFICPALCFYTAILNTTSSQYSCWIAVDFAMKSRLTEKTRVVGDLVIRIKFCPCWRLLGNSSKKTPPLNKYLLWYCYVTLCTLYFSVLWMAKSDLNSAAFVSPW